MTESKPSIAAFETEKRSVMPVIRVMLVDDSAVIRGMLTRIIESESDLRVVSSASDGAMALTVLRSRPVDVVVLDLEMPNMDGLTALPKLKQTQPSVKIIIVSSLTRENAEIALKAMRLGAEDYLSKPNTTSEMTSIAAFRRDVINKIRALGSKALEIDRLNTESGAAPLKLKNMAATLLSTRPLLQNNRLLAPTKNLLSGDKPAMPPVGGTPLGGTPLGGTPLGGTP
ncbi:MAG: response regulator, partial [Alphaproteobacteria bacterium]|nr:response regulator [Alphaproteobacteria bacterium]